MNKFVFKKVAELTTEKTELSVVDIHLATVKEIDNKLKSYGLPFSDISKVQNNVSTTQSALRNMEKDINQTLQEAKQIELKAKELGLNAGLETSISYANEKLKQIVSANTLFSRFVSELEKLK